jgi:polyvinyl alcohol dehydrogenase (cytochrome)
MFPEQIVLALESGSMMMIGAFRTAAERHAVAEYLSGKPLGHEIVRIPPEEAFCKQTVPFTDPFRAGHWNGWGADLANSRYQSSEAAGLSASDIPKLKLKWAFGFPGDVTAYAQPAVAGGRLFTGSAGRRVYSLDPASGCMYWVVGTEAPVRTAISIGATGESRYAAYFGDFHANVYAVNAKNGDLLWKTRVEDLPEARITGAPILHEGRLYVPVSSTEELTGADPSYECCKFRGSVAALDAKTGKILWKTYTISEPVRPTRKNKVGTQLWGPSGVGVWSSPTLDPKRNALYVGTGDSYTDPPAPMSDAILALDMDSGKILWARQITAGDAFNLGCRVPDKSNCPDSNGPDSDFGSSPILVELEGDRRALIAGQKSAVVHALDPDREGQILWQTRVGKGGTLGGIQWGPAVDREKVYAALSDIVAKPTPMGLQADPTAGGGLFALRLADGKKVWEALPPGCGDRIPCSPAQSAAVTVIPGVVFSGSVDGHLRAYSAEDGKILWDFDTVRDYQTVNGVKARGGSLDGSGAVVVGGMLFVNSGYPGTGGMPGNVLLAFSVDGK